MKDKKKKMPPEDRLIHIRLSNEVHRALRIIAAKEDVTLQEFVSSLVERAVASEMEKRGGK